VTVETRWVVLAIAVCAALWWMGFMFGTLNESSRRTNADLSTPHCTPALPDDTERCVRELDVLRRRVDYLYDHPAR